MDKVGLISAFPCDCSIVARFVCGGELWRFELEISSKTNTPSETFRVFEEAGEKLRKADKSQLFNEHKITSALIKKPPCFESCNEKGAYIISTTFIIEFISEVSL